jgi:sensor histidine kinase YesM
MERVSCELVLIDEKMERTKIDYLKKNWLGILTIVLLWTVNLGEYAMVDVKMSFIRSSIFTVSLIIVFLLFRYYYPALKKNKIELYKLIFFSSIILMILVTSERYFSAKILSEKHYFYWDMKDRYLVMDFIFSLLPIGMAMIFSWSFLLADKNKAHELHIEKLKTLNQEAELNELKNQLNPHFLFNALSNIYSIAYLGDKQTPDKIMQLSKMLRYVIYETNVEFIELSKEINYLNYYIDFQKFKIEKDQNIEFTYESCNQNLMIAPLILLPFLENSFKHSQIATEKEAWIKMSLKSEKDVIHFNLANTISKKTAPEILNNKGIGLDNIKKRLDLIYPKRYVLNIDSEDVYQVQLTLKNHE